MTEQRTPPPAAAPKVDPNAMVAVPQPDGSVLNVSMGTLMQRFTTASALETQQRALESQARFVEAGRRVLQHQNDPTRAAEEAARLVGGQGGDVSDPFAGIDVNAMDPAQKALLHALKMTRQELQEMRVQAASTDARSEVASRLSDPNLPLFQNKAARDLGELVMLAARAQNPRANLDDVAVHVHGLVQEMAHGHLQQAFNAGTANANQPPPLTGSATPTTTAPEPPKAADIKSGALRARVADKMGGFLNRMRNP